MSLASKLGATFSGTISKSIDILGTGSITVQKQHSESLSDGTGSGQADVFYHDRVAIAAEGTQDYDLSGALTNLFGDAAVFATLKGILIVNTSDELATPTTATVKVDGNLYDAIFNATSGYVDLVPGGFLAFGAPTTGEDVTDSTGDTITLTNNSDTYGAQVDVIFIGTSA